QHGGARDALGGRGGSGNMLEEALEQLDETAGEGHVNELIVPPRVFNRAEMRPRALEQLGGGLDGSAEQLVEVLASRCRDALDPPGEIDLGSLRYGQGLGRAPPYGDSARFETQVVPSTIGVELGARRDSAIGIAQGGLERRQVEAPPGL